MRAACERQAALMNRRDALTLALAMSGRQINPTQGSYAQAYEVKDASRWLFISGQTPERQDGSVPEGFKAQCRMVWTNIERQLRDAGMSLDNLVKVTIYLSDRRYRSENAQVRREVLKERTPALTIIIAGIYDEAWLLEIEAVAAA
jgi:2-iminobutanoate/2-iminopropanoate deaminase